MSATPVNDNNNPLLLPQLPYDALVEILSRLPVDSILLFKCVCKSWYSLFNTPTFASKHLHNIKSQHVFLKYAFPDDDESYTKNWVTCFFSDNPHASVNDELEVVNDFFDDLTDLLLVGHCDGIVALALGDDAREGVLLFNPATGESRTLPHSTSPRVFDYDVHAFIGFGYDPRTKDYKVVRDVAFHWRKTDTVTHRVEVFSVGTDSSWREIDGDDVGNAASVPNSDSHFEQYFNGFYYWRGVEKEETNVLISFDMAGEVFRKMPMPHFCDHNVCSHSDIVRIVPRIGVYNNECVALYVTDLPSNRGLMEVWVMKEFGVKESWTKQLTITASGIEMNHPLLFWKNNAEMLYEEVFIDEEQGNLLSYNLVTRESTILPLHSSCLSFSARRYMKTIVSVSRRAELNQDLII